MDPLARRVAARFAAEQKAPHVDSRALSRFQDAVTHAQSALNETIRAIIHIDDPTVKKMTYQTFHDMLKLEVEDYQKMMHEVEKNLH